MPNRQAMQLWLKEFAVKIGLRPKWATRFVRSRTTLRLTQQEALNEDAVALIASTSKQFLAKNKVVEALTAKIEEFGSSLWRVRIFQYSVALLLCFSILGLKFELSLLGLTLADLGKIKEIILVALMLSTLIEGWLYGEIKYLKSIRRAVLLRLHGEKNIAVMLAGLMTLDGEDSLTDLGLTPSASKFFPVNIVLPLLVLSSIVVKFLVVLVGIFVVDVIIALNVWQDSNLIWPFGKVLAGVYLVMVLTHGLALAIWHSKKLMYRDRDKADALDRLAEDKDAYRNAVREYLKLDSGN